LAEAAMTALLGPGIADKLAHICRMFSSDHDGERASAAAMADKIVRAHGLTWAEIILPQRHSIEEQIGIALAGLDALTRWERGFIYSINGRRNLSPKQRNLLNSIAAEARAFAERRT
jgi:hypothetical protein